MYKEHPLFRPPENETIKIWKYMDFVKFISLLDSSSLFFTRADKFDDPFEGSWPRKNVDFREHINRENNFEELNEFDKKFYKKLRECTAINCWHMNDNESFAMWKIYAENNNGIAIQSTYSRLKNSITDKEDIMVGIVDYIDYYKEKIRDNLLAPFIKKSTVLVMVKFFWTENSKQLV